VELLGSLLTLREPRVLEIRPRTGAILDALRRSCGASVYALPIFESQQEMVKGLYGIPADALIDFEHFEIPYEGPFDLIVSNHMLTHAVAPGEFLDVVRAALAPGGHLYLYNEMDEVEFLSDSKSIFRVMNPFHMQVFTPTSLTRALAAHGFETVFLGHTDRIQMMCLARSATPATVVMPKDERKRRLRRYTAARDFAILSLPDDRRGAFAHEWDAVVERAVIEGTATLDERGRVQLRTGTGRGDLERDGVDDARD
jgi:SAM-dependent methyltransferase